MSKSNAKTEAAQLRRAAVKTEQRTLRFGAARRAIEGLSPGVDIDVLTYGQFSLIDLWEAICAELGPGHIFACTWAIGRDESERIMASMRKGGYLSARLLLDRAVTTVTFGLMARGQGKELEETAGVELRTSRVHAKSLLYDVPGRGSVIVRTSMNLNYNPRTEFASISMDPATVEWWRAEMEHIWAHASPGLTNYANLPPAGAAGPATPDLGSSSGLTTAKRVSTGPRVKR